ncbi:MAG TPA: phosphatase PAP2 family protein [Pedococcus sp.]
MGLLRDDTPAEERIGRRDLTEWRSRTGRALASLALRLAEWTAARWVLVLTAAVGGLVVLVLTKVSAEVYESVAENDGVAGLDQPVLDLAVSWRSPGLDQAVTWFTNLGGGIGMTAIMVVAVVLMTVLWRSRTPVVLVLVAAAGSLAITVTGKHLVGRLRPPRSLAVPPYEDSPSFPSGHTLNTTVLVGVVVYLVLRRLESTWARVAVLVGGGLFVLGIGLSRVYLGHHWLTDVAVGWSVGLAWLAVVVTAHRLFLTVRRRRGQPQPSSATQDSPDRVNPSRS